MKNFYLSKAPYFQHSRSSVSYQNLRKLLQTCLTIAIIMLLNLTIHAQSTSIPEDPGRISVTTKGSGKTITTPDGELLRGTSFLVHKGRYTNNYDEFETILQESYYEECVRYGLNAVRVCMFDPWMNSQGYLANDFNNPDDVSVFLGHLDSVVNLASRHNMHVILNYHDVGEYAGEYGNPSSDNIGYLKDVWNTVAPYFKNRTHVSYELMNEPQFAHSAFTNQMLDSVALIYNIVHNHAPNTHISLFSFAGTSKDDITMTEIVDNFESRHTNLVDWTNASVAYHPYATRRTSAPIVELMQNYPAFSSESNFPDDDKIPGMILEGDAERSRSMDGELFVHETLERIEQSWFQWKISNPERFKTNYVPQVVRDADEKDYIWFHAYVNDTLYKNFFFGTSVNTDEFTWHTDNTTGTISQDDVLIINNAGATNSKIVNELSSGLSLDISNEPYICFRAKTTASSNLTYDLVVYDSDGGSSGTQFTVELAGDGEFHQYTTNLSASSVDLTKINKIVLDRGSRSSESVEIQIDNFVVGRLEYTLNITSSSGGTTYPPGLRTYASGREVNVEARPNELFELITWEGANSSDIVNITVQMDANKSLNAVYEDFILAKWYYLSSNYYKNWFRSTTMNSDDFTWNNNDADWTGQTFSQEDELVVHEAGQKWSKICNTFSSTINISSNPVINFDAKTTAGEDLDYKLTIIDDNGGSTYSQFSVTLNGDGEYHSYSIDLTGSWADLSIVKEIYLSKGGTGASFPCQIYIDNFEAGQPATYSLATNATNGAILRDPTATNNEYDEGTVVEATGDPASGYEFTGWEGAETGSDNPVEIVMSNNKSLTANFSPIMVNSISIIEGDQDLEVGETVDLTEEVLPVDALDKSVIWSADPTGIVSVDPSTGQVTADAAGIAIVTATANDGSNVSQSIEVAVTASSIQTPYGGTAWAVPGKIEAENYDEGGEGVSFHDNDDGNHDCGGRSENVDVQTTSDTDGGCNVGWIANGEWLEFTVDVASSGKYTVQARVASKNSGGTMEISFDEGAATTGDLTIPVTGGWQTWTTIEASGITLEAGEQIMRIDMKSSGFNVNYLNIVAENSPDPWYEITSTCYINYFTGTTLNSDDFTWHNNGQDWTGQTFSSDDELIVSGAGHKWSQIANTFATGTTIDISGNPVVSFKAKSTAGSDLTYTLSVKDAAGGSSYSQFNVTIIGDGTWHEYDVSVSGAWSDLTQINEIVLAYGDQVTVDCELRIDDFEVGQDIKSSHKLQSVYTVDVKPEICVYPNPVEDEGYLTLEVNDSESINNMSLTIFDITGRLIYNKIFPAMSIKTFKHQLPSSMFAGKGLYIISVQSGHTAVKKQIVIK